MSLLLTGCCRRSANCCAWMQPVKLGGRAFDVLVALVERRDRTVSKNELMDLVWPNVVVEENNLEVQIVTLRKLFGYAAIATVPGRGYRFTLPVDAEGTADEFMRQPPPDFRSRRRSNLPAAFRFCSAVTRTSRHLRVSWFTSTRHSRGSCWYRQNAFGAGRRRSERKAEHSGVWWVDFSPMSGSIARAQLPLAVALGLSLDGASRRCSMTCNAARDRQVAARSVGQRRASVRRSRASSTVAPRGTGRAPPCHQPRAACASTMNTSSGRNRFRCRR